MIIAAGLALIFFGTTIALGSRLKQRDAENHALDIDNEARRKILQDIVEMQTPRANATVKRMAKAARGWS